MTDLELNKVCGEAMGYSRFELSSDGTAIWCHECYDYWQPLTDDAQAMALVKRFKLELYWVGSENYGDEFDTDDWMVAQSTVKLSNCGNDVRNADLNRAICECVAKMQQAKG